MNKSQWLNAWAKIKNRFPQWEPTATESEDWCITLRVYTTEMVDEVGRSVRMNYTAKIPQLKWYINECEKRKREYRINHAPAAPTWQDVRDEFEKEREESISRLEEVPIEELREATVAVLKKHGELVKKPDDGNVREWKNTLRSLVYCHIFKKENKQ